MSIKLTGATSGSIELDVPDAVNGGDISLTLPNGVGTADQVLKNGSTPGTLEFAQPKAQPGQVIETIAGLCNGTSVTVGSGTYTITNVTSAQDLTTSYADVTGSSFTYTPPSGTKVVVYDFQVQVGYAGAGIPLCHFKFFVDSTEVQVVRSTAFPYYDGTHRIRVPLSVGNATEDISNGKIGTWTSNKTLKLQCREYHASGNPAKLHFNYHWDGSAGNFFNCPSLEIRSIA